jgi:hypothetical protein
LAPIVIGRCGYDNALVAHCLRRRIPVVDGTLAVAALHQAHDYGHVGGGWTTVQRGEDAVANRRQMRLAGSLPTASDADYILKDSVLRSWPCRGDRMRRTELRARFEWGSPRVGHALKVLGQALRDWGLIRVTEPTLTEVVDALRRTVVAND